MSVFELSVNAIETLMIYCFFDRYLFRKKKLNLLLLFSFVLLSFIVLNLSNTIFIFESYYIIIPISINLIYVYLQYSNTSLEKLFICIFVYNIISIINLSIITISCYILYGNIKITSLFESNYYIAIIIFSKIVFSIVLIFISNVRKKHNENLTNSHTIIFITVALLLSLITLSFENLLYTDSIAEELLTTSIAALLILSIYFIVIFLKIIINANKTKIKSLENQIIIDEKKRLKQLREINEHNIKLKHDLKHILTYVYNSIDKKSSDELKTIILDYENSIEINNSFIITENSILNFCINKIHEQSNTSKIDLTTNINSFYKPNIADNDLLLILSNIFDNAYENCGGIRKIEINIYKRNEYYIIEVLNSIKSENIDINNLVSTKDNRELHGYGIRSVKTLINKYHGNIIMESEDYYFMVKIALK